MKEVYEIIFNILGKPPKLAYVPHEIAQKVARVVKNWEYLNLDQINKNKLDIVVSPTAKTLSDLCVQPVSFAHGIEKYLEDFKTRMPHRKDELER